MFNVTEFFSSRYQTANNVKFSVRLDWVNKICHKTWFSPLGRYTCLQPYSRVHFHFVLALCQTSDVKAPSWHYQNPPVSVHVAAAFTEWRVPVGSTSQVQIPEFFHVCSDNLQERHVKRLSTQASAAV